MPVKDKYLPPDDPRHGTKNGYDNYACRCVPCSEAVKVYHRERRERIREEQLNRFSIRAAMEPEAVAKARAKVKTSKYCSDNDFDYSVLTGPQTDPTALCTECSKPRPELALLYQDEFCSSKCCRIYHGLVENTATYGLAVRRPYIDWGASRNFGPRQEPLNTDDSYTESAASKVA